MKYIRIKDKIIPFWKANVDNIGGVEIIKTADTIEELVDKYLRVFVGKDEEMKPYVMLDKDDKHFSENESVVYACIWIQLPNGAYRLEPVAKLNEKGDLKLL